MRLLVSADGSVGDIVPMLELARRATLRGHDVLVTLPPDFADLATERGVRFEVVGHPVKEFLQGSAAAILGQGREFLRRAREYAARSIAAQFRVLPDLARGRDLMLGGGLVFALHSVGELCRVPTRWVAYVPQTVPSALHPPVGVRRQRLPRLVNRALWRLHEAVMRRTFSGEMARARESVGLGPFRRGTYDSFLGEGLILACDIELIPEDPDPRRRITRVAALSAPAATLPTEVETFLNKGPAPVYVGFGSMPAHDAAQASASIVRSARDLGTRLVLSRGWAELDAKPSDDVLVVGAVSHAALFPRMRLVVHHGGAGTTATTLRAGVPQLLVPHLLDQYYFADRVARAGLGPPAADRVRLDAADLAARMREALAPRYAVRARAVRDAIRAREATEPDLVTVLERDHA